MIVLNKVTPEQMRVFFNDDLYLFNEVNYKVTALLLFNYFSSTFAANYFEVYRFWKTQPISDDLLLFAYRLHKALCEKFDVSGIIFQKRYFFNFIRCINCEEFTGTDGEFLRAIISKTYTVSSFESKSYEDFIVTFKREYYEFI